MKNTDLHIRISEKEYDLLKRVASQFNMTLSKFVLSVMVPYCLKIDSMVGKTNGN